MTLQPHQVSPEGQWSCWILLGGRGAGKTHAGAHWLGKFKPDPVVAIGPSYIRDSAGFGGAALDGITFADYWEAGEDLYRGMTFAAGWYDEPLEWAPTFESGLPLLALARGPICITQTWRAIYPDWFVRLLLAPSTRVSVASVVNPNLSDTAVSMLRGGR